jgi:hypothetical protein
MRPASTTRAFPYEYRPENQSKLRSTRQDSIPVCSLPPRPHSIFVLNFDAPYRQHLALSLRQLRYSLFIPEEHGTSLYELSDQIFQQADFILVDLTNLNHDRVWVPLRRIGKLRRSDGIPLMVHCFSRVYRGPEFHLLVERLGARLAYYA